MQWNSVDTVSMQCKEAKKKCDKLVEIGNHVDTFTTVASSIVAKLPSATNIPTSSHY